MQPEIARVMDRDNTRPRLHIHEALDTYACVFNYHQQTHSCIHHHHVRVSPNTVLPYERQWLQSNVGTQTIQKLGRMLL